MHCTESNYLFIGLLSMSLLGCRLHEVGDFVLFTFVGPRCLEQGLAPSRCSINICPPPIHPPHRSQVFFPKCNSDSRLSHWVQTPVPPCYPRGTFQLLSQSPRVFDPCYLFSVVTPPSQAPDSECLGFLENERPSSFWTSVLCPPAPSSCTGQLSLTRRTPAR